MVQALSDNYSDFTTPLLDKVITYKNIIPNNYYYYTKETIQPFISTLPTFNYIKCFCPIHGDQQDNEKHKCSKTENDNYCISSLRYNCAHCSNENGRSLSHIAFQKHLRKFHSNILEKMKFRDDLKKNDNSIPAYYTKAMMDNEISKSDIVDNKMDKPKFFSYFNNSNLNNKKSQVYHHKIKIKSFPIKKNSRNMSLSSEPKNNNSNFSSSFIYLQLICACELLIEKTLEIVFHESYLSYDIPTKLMVLKYAITDNKISCDDTIKVKMINYIEDLENYFNPNYKVESMDLEKELRTVLQFLLKYTKNNEYKN